MIPDSIKDKVMNNILQIYPAHACQHCGSETKFVETLIDDEFSWNEQERRYEPNHFTDMFEHTGNDRCAECGKDWTGA
jgi:hypothetical protein